MKYKIFSTGNWSGDNLLDEYPCLEQFGFRYEDVERTCKIRIGDENGRPIHQICSYTKRVPYIEIADLAQLNELIKAVENPIILGEEENTIEIYDGYRE